MTTLQASPSSAASVLPSPPVFPTDLGQWTSGSELFQIAAAAAARAGGASWLNLLSEDPTNRPVNDLSLLLTYCYLQSVYHTIDVLRRLETDPNLRDLRERTALRTEQIRRFRRDCRRELTDCLTRALVALWQRRVHPSAPPRMPIAADATRPDFGFLEPFYLHAQDRIDRAVIFDSMAQDE